MSLVSGVVISTGCPLCGSSVMFVQLPLNSATQHITVASDVKDEETIRTIFPTLKSRYRLIGQFIGLLAI